MSQQSVQFNIIKSLWSLQSVPSVPSRVGEADDGRKGRRVTCTSSSAALVVTALVVTGRALMVHGHGREGDVGREAAAAVPATSGGQVQHRVGGLTFACEAIDRWGEVTGPICMFGGHT